MKKTCKKRNPERSHNIPKNGTHFFRKLFLPAKPPPRPIRPAGGGVTGNLPIFAPGKTVTSLKTMWILIVSLVVIGTVAAGVSLLLDKDTPVTFAAGDCSSCGGTNPKCEQECMMEAAVKETEYFDDEELDAYRGRPGDGYTPDETEEFRRIMETMGPEDLRAWNRSLILRGVNMPDGIKDEYILLSEG